MFNLLGHDSCLIFNGNCYYYFSENKLIHTESINTTRPHYRNGRYVNVGDRIRRTCSWQHGIQGCVIGAVTQILATGAKITKIRWDNGTVDLCIMGEGNSYELQLVE